ncbi:uncharacterized protein LOC18448561 isoform X2 [Amborella trichopoda]|nr:uncharacterized protein LOC18448561 isoform X2 [Amborella trichopoda]|eukprot:XP_020531887.1 uncharacterized protein LOC18448561 isoform X2 [Amborella trichopoda]
MGECSHISVDFDDIVSVILENYESFQTSSEKSDQDKPCSLDYKVLEFLKTGDNAPPISELLENVPSLPQTAHAKDDVGNPKYWSRICLHNMAKLSKEATTIRRVLEPLFRYFDKGNHWSPQNGLAFMVLLDMLLLMEKLGQNTHFLLSLLIKHLDHKNVAKEPNLQVDIIGVTTRLSQYSKLQASVAIIGAISDLMRHLRKSMQCSFEATNLGDDINKWNHNFQSSLEECLIQLANKVGDLGPILDMVAVMLENISTSTIVARTTISAIYRTTQIVAFIPNVLYNSKEFPEALFHQLLLAMVHPDHETRVGAHRVLSVVLLPSSVAPQIGSVSSESPNGPLSTTVPGLSSCAGLFEMIVKEQSSKLGALPGGKYKGNMMEDGMKEKLVQLGVDAGNEKVNNDVKLYTAHPSQSRSYSMKLSSPRLVTDGGTITETEKDAEPTSLRLSSPQMSLMLSSLWVQAVFPENAPANFEAIAHTYNLILLLSLVKNSSHETLVRAFQLAYSLRSISLEREGGLQPSRRRSLFTLATCMLISLARIYSVISLIRILKALLTDRTLDPYLHLVEENRLVAVVPSGKPVYGSKEDDSAALKSLSAIEITEEHSKESYVSLIMNNLGSLPEVESSSIRQQLLEEFAPDDAYPLGSQLFMETPWPYSPSASKDQKPFDEIMSTSFCTDDDASLEMFGNQINDSTQLSDSEVINVNQLIESVLETARQVASVPVSMTPVPYDQMKEQCEALVMGKQQKMSLLMNGKHQEDLVLCDLPQYEERKGLSSPQKKIYDTRSLEETDEIRMVVDCSLFCSSEYQQSFRLPPSSPFDKFLKAAGC